MDVVIVTRFYPPETGGGGIATYAGYLAAGLAANGHRVRVVSHWVAGAPVRHTASGVDVVRIRPLAIPYRFRRLPFVGRYLRFCNDLAYADTVRRQLLGLAGERPFDIVEYADIDAEGLFHPLDLAPAVIKLHMPHLVLRRFGSRADLPYDTASVAGLEKRAIRRVMGLSSPSRWLAQAVAKECRLDAAAIAKVPNPIDTSLFKPDRDPEPDTMLVLYVGRLEALKGAPTFADAIPQIGRVAPGARFMFVGADRPVAGGESMRALLETRLAATGMGGRVTFLGHAAPEVFRDYYRQAAVCVVPSVVENCPYTLLEAMACGKPVVVTDAYGMREAVQAGETGLCFAPGDSADLACKVLRLLNDRPLATRLGKAAREVVQREYGLQTGTERTLAFYQSVLTGW